MVGRVSKSSGSNVTALPNGIGFGSLGNSKCVARSSHAIVNGAGPGIRKNFKLDKR